MLYRVFFKSVFDRIVSVIVLFITLPFFICAMFLLWFSNNGKIFFIQERPGKNGRSFNILKFKTMNDKKDSKGKYLPDEARLTAVGKLIRKTSIDELPQLINVLKGDMSLIGPRPLLPEYLDLYNDFQRRRHEVKPGITGWAQINGRNELNWGKKFEYDVWYVDNLSFGLDIKIIFKTIYNVIRANGISSDSSVTMEKFTGN